MKSKIERAAEFAKAAHEGIDQRRKYTNEPYIVHPQLVAEIVSSVTDDEDMICAAWLHDVVEDTPVTLEEIRNELNLADTLTVPELEAIRREFAKRYHPDAQIGNTGDFERHMKLVNVIIDEHIQRKTSA